MLPHPVYDVPSSRRKRSRRETVTYKVAFCVVSANNIHKELVSSPFFSREKKKKREREDSRKRERTQRSTQRGPSRRGDRVRSPEGIRNDEGTTSIEIRFRRSDSIVRTSPIDPTQDKGKRPIPEAVVKICSATGVRSINLSFSLSLFFFLVASSALTKREDWRPFVAKFYCCVFSNSGKYVASRISRVFVSLLTFYDNRLGGRVFPFFFFFTRTGSILYWKVLLFFLLSSTLGEFNRWQFFLYWNLFVTFNDFAL